MTLLALDIGGAFIKYAVLAKSGQASRGIIPFELWRSPGRLQNILKELRAGKDRPTAITMTGELCDCFASRRDGVRHIVNAAQKAFGGVAVHSLSGGLLSPARAIREYKMVASANWTLVPLHLAPQAKDFLFVDIGSTTADLTPVRRGRIANKGWTDHARLKQGELLYTGALRTPLAAAIHAVQMRGGTVQLAAETFAITADVHLLLGNITRSGYRCPTPDGGPKTKSAARKRIARALLADEGELGKDDVVRVARQIATAQRGQITNAAARSGLPVIAAGTGAFMLNAAFRAGELTPHPLARAEGITDLDPSLALAWRLRAAL